MSLCTDSRENANFERFASWGGAWFRIWMPCVSDTLSEKTIFILCRLKSTNSTSFKKILSDVPFVMELHRSPAVTLTKGK